MKIFNLAVLTLLLGFLFFSSGNAQGPQGKKFGFGLILGDPTGGTIKYWTSRENAFDFYIGSSYFGKLRIGADYLWHFDAFNSNIVKMYAGIGLAVGVGSGGRGIWYKEDRNKFYYWEDDNSIGLGARGLFGINIVPKSVPLEIFLELGPLMGVTPNYGVNIDAAIGIRFYP